MEYDWNKIIEKKTEEGKIKSDSRGWLSNTI